MAGINFDFLFDGSPTSASSSESLTDSCSSGAEENAKTNLS